MWFVPRRIPERCTLEGVIYLERKPSPALAGCVETLWYACAPNLSHQRELVLPGGKIQFVISLAADHLTECTATGDAPLAPALLVGARTSAELIATRDMKKLAGVVFRPGGLGPWLRERADLFYEQSQSLSDLGPIKRLGERLRELAATPEVTLQVLDEMLCEQASARERRSHVLEALRLLRSLSVRQTAHALGISERRLHIVFSEDVGLSPKQWSRVRRFQRVVRALHQGADVRWAELAVTCGYADQSHFSRDFRSFSGLDPTTYSASRGRWQNHVAV
jgi:AraC-like DNA-binding protein